MSQNKGRRQHLSSLNPALSTSCSSGMRVVITQKMEEDMMKLNAEYLQRQDVSFRSIIEKTSQAAIYLFDGEAWSDAKAAGCLMLYDRNVTPRLGFIILNRLAVPNWNHVFMPNGLEIQVQGKYLLFKNGSGIFCLWFYEDNHSEKFARLLSGFGCKIEEDTD